MPTVYNYTADLCPALQGPSSLLLISGETPSLSVAHTTGDTTTVTSNLNQNAVMEDVIAVSGTCGGVYHITTTSAQPGELALSDPASGTNITVAAGQAMFAGAAQRPASGNVNKLVDNTTSWLWFSEASVVERTADVNPPPGPDRWVFIGRVTMAAGVITEIDGSGVVYYRGDSLMRWTADTTVPTDTPPAGVIFKTRSVITEETWVWTGQEYISIGGGNGFPLVPLVINAGQTRVIPANWGLVTPALTNNGTLTVNGVLRNVGLT